MKVLITRSENPASFKLAYLLRNETILFGDLHPDFPPKKSISIAHEILRFCLDNEVNIIYPMSLEELLPLKRSKVLFEEFDIKLMLSNNESLIFSNPSAEANNYNELSSMILSLGYPNHNIALANAEGYGDLILLNDETKDFETVWNKINAVSFIQLGKLFNRPDFQKMSLYTHQKKIKTSHFLFDGEKFHFLENIENEMVSKLENMIYDKSALGFYQVDYEGLNILRIKSAVS
ncbi:hypothetical protein I5M32_05290 [Pedobacter sp. SD-b]|uniref:Uncharacterized protein n=1 Tax=Pedobacter segetis TaxID=2793069 RepID=A0ABS1BHK8_9SPHI|nr:hypothetical protein [Pedobacter segetis]MBK0382370.1 hypothetical protein [Pedobacter segetis]